MKREIIEAVLPSEWLSDDTKYHQPHRSVHHWRPNGRLRAYRTEDHCRYIWRYGAPWWRCFLRKDPSKVDRSAAYAGRYVAKNIVAAGLADRCEIQVSYAIGVAEPTSISIDTFGTAKVAESTIIDLVRTHFDLRPKGLINMLDLKRPIYRPPRPMALRPSKRTSHGSERQSRCTSGCGRNLSNYGFKEFL